MSDNFASEEFAEEVTAALEEALAGTIEGAEEDLRALAAEITQDIANMAESGEVNPDLMEEWGNQLQLLGEARRLRANAEGWKFVAKVAQIAARTAVAAVKI